MTTILDWLRQVSALLDEINSKAQALKSALIEIQALLLSEQQAEQIGKIQKLTEGSSATTVKMQNAVKAGEVKP